MNNKIITIILVALVSLTANAETFSDNHETVKNHFISDKEKTTKDALWTTEDIFKVGVFDDGSNRNGYAEYVCLILLQHGFKGKNIWVHVIDISKLLQNKEWVKLGDTFCP